MYSFHTSGQILFYDISNPIQDIALIRINGVPQYIFV